MQNVRGSSLLYLHLIMLNSTFGVLNTELLTDELNVVC